jgi:hypothetical protein
MLSVAGRAVGGSAVVPWPDHPSKSLVSRGFAVLGDDAGWGRFRAPRQPPGLLVIGSHDSKHPALLFAD